MAVKDEVTSTKVDEAATFRVNVKLVLARVVVRDSKGNALGNLHKEDFELFDNGKPQIISHFDAEHNKPETVGPENGNGTETSKAAGQPTVPLRYVAYLFDDTHLTFENINQVRQAAERRVNALPPTERAAIFSTSGQSMLDSPTTEPNCAKRWRTSSRIPPSEASTQFALTSASIWLTSS